MKRMIIILSVLFYAHLAAAEYPVQYQCTANSEEPLEGRFCADYKDSLESSGFIVLEYDENSPYFRIIVLPTARDGYLSITIASNFLYPPLAGFALSAHLSSYIMSPGGIDQDGVLDYIARQNIRGISLWMIAFDKETEKNKYRKNVLECSND